MLRLLRFYSIPFASTKESPPRIQADLLSRSVAPDLLRRPRQTWGSRTDVPALHRPIPHGIEHPRGRISAILGLFSRRRPSLLKILPPDLRAVRVHPAPHHLGLRAAGRDPGTAGTDRPRGRPGALLPRSSGQQSGLGHPDLRARRLGPEEVQAGPVLHGRPLLYPHCLGGHHLSGFRYHTIHVPSRGTRPNSYVHSPLPLSFPFPSLPHGFVFSKFIHSHLSYSQQPKT